MDPGWYEHGDTAFKTYATYDFTTKAVTRNEVLNVSSLKKQPEYNIDKNCTAVLVGHHLVRYTWIVIPCDQNITATYFCQSKLFLPITDFRAELNPLNSTCDPGWFMITNRPVCYQLLKPDRAISFYEGEKACSLRNSSIFRVDVTKEPPVDEASFKRWFLLQYQHATNVLPDIVYTGSVMRTILFGRLLDNSFVQNLLPRIVELDKNTKQIFAIGTGVNECGIIQSLGMQTILRDQFGALQDRWFFKYRPCSKYIDVTTLVCEKPSRQYNQTCSSFHFECSDGTCLLLIYACDMSTDCFDGSDETGCSYYNHDNATDGIRLQTTSTISRDYIPCTLNYDCMLYTESESFPLLVHSVCDGIYTTGWLRENNTCSRNSLVHIHLSYMIGVKKSNKRSFKSTRALMYLFKQEVTYFDNVNSSYKLKNAPSSDTNVTLKPYMSNCRFGGKGREMIRMCQISAHIPPCNIVLLSQICVFIWCPGMFKCIHTYCLPMSVICNGHQECPDGEDEMYCSNLECPGLLKCRGENRCVGTSEICDGKVNCRFSFDDEINCEKCPIGCICHFYFMLCSDVKNILTAASIKQYAYVKGISFKGKITNITKKYFVMYLALVYLDISYCGIEHIVGFENSVPLNSNLLFVDVKYNNLIHTSFLFSNALSKLVSIDLSHNKIIRINGKFIRMYYIKLLRIGGNPLRHIYFDFYESLNSHRIIDILHTQYSDRMNINLNIINHTSVEVHVTDPFMCCTLKTQCKMFISRSNVSCFQLIKTQSLKYIFYFLSTITFVVSTTRFLVIIYRSIYHKKHSNHHNIIKINQSLCELLMCTYFISVCLGNALSSNVITWRKNIICRIMSGFLYIALLNSLVFKTFSVITMSLKIKFPFKHQCRWLRFAVPAAGIAWLCGCSFFLFSVHLSIFLDSYLFLDRFCTFGECNNRINRVIFLHFAIIFIDTVCIGSSFIVGIQSFLVLKRTTIKRATTDSVSAVSIMLKVGKLFYIQLVFRFVLYISFIAKLTQITIPENYCFIVFLLLLPVECILSGVIEFMV